MATGRNAIGYDGIGYNAETYYADLSTITYDIAQVDGSAQVGLAVTLSADNTIALCADADRVLGKLLKVESDGACTVQNNGNVQLPTGNGATVTRNTAIVGALGASSAKGYVRNAVASESPKAGHEVLNIEDAANPWVKLIN